MKCVLITGARAPVALHLARLFHAASWRVVLADTLHHPLAAASKACARYVQFPPPDTHPEAFAAALRALMESESPSLVLPTCEEVFYLAWAFERYGLGPALFAPPFATLRRAHNKALFAAGATKSGLFPPATVELTCNADLDKVRARSRDLVFKPVWSRFASRVLIRPKPDALDAITPTGDEPWVAQEYIPGEELCCYALARNGRLLGLASYHPKHRAGPGAGIYFEPVHDPAITRACERYVFDTHWTGQLSFDFRRDADGYLRVLECNPRATSGVHFFGSDTNLPDVISQGLPASPSISTPLMIPAAMWIYGLPAALTAPLAWLHDMRRATDALAWPGDRLPVSAQPRAMLELARIACRDKTSLIAASTNGIAWNGNPIAPRAPRQPQTG